MSRVDDKLVIAYTENRESVWVRADSDVGDTIISPDKIHKFMVVRVDRYATREPDNLLRRAVDWTDERNVVEEATKHPSKFETVKAEDLLVGDEILYCNEWRTVVSTYVHPKSCYQKANLTQPNSTIPLSVKIGRRTLIERKTRGFIMSVALLNCHDLAKSVQAKLIDYQALADAPERVEVAPSVFVDKEPIMSALKASVKAEYNKLGEQLKKL